MKKYIYLVILFFTLAIASCKKSYLDINQNPNSPTEESITPELILPYALNATASNAGAGYAAVARWMGYWTRGGDYGPSTEEESYNITTGFGAGGWASWYDNLYDYSVIAKKANASGQKFYEGIAKAMKTVGFMYLVDTYNNVPYSKAFDVNGNILPAYDKGADIYKDLFVQLDEAMALVSAPMPGDNGLNTFTNSTDIMFGGSVTLWKKFINTQRLKLLIHTSNVNSSYLNTELAKITSDGFLNSGQTAQVDPGYKKAENSAKVSQQNPFWNNYKLDINGTAIDKYNRANNYVLNELRGGNDIRYQYYFERAATPLSGNTYFGYDYGFVDSDPDNPKSANSSGVAGPGLAKSFSQPQWMLTATESLFLQAEAQNRGWTLSNGAAFAGATAAATYGLAITESFTWLGVTNATTEANAIIAANPFSTANLYKQKYLSLVGVNNFEAWVDFRRLNTLNSGTAPDQSTGPYPHIPRSESPSIGTNHIPLRYRYPQNEYNYNAANVALENNPEPQTSPIFWDNN
ncbi:SusD/RagB family nutrient-binding outer membrane lipoprotein [Ferruginibacter sp. HRS2-29]|uniref:SusD/RagB family nutrient-binding outer membrane lipoprotein n=1 Tax=Ferruginibacter sp. HRS2-29 TaxID=2487334 RepID=UPI0020CB6B98|nr:SusD/RagB family nutrient-binding outer membrane lipoprotein [Ferruginibacter sp. HRS2-29]MCP9753308.1 SusD/RagB family nutrient-binding outer membrane lipoprotein [Ferruginibacter sp. HRS2-29]